MNYDYSISKLANGRIKIWLYSPAIRVFVREYWNNIGTSSNCITVMPDSELLLLIQLKFKHSQPYFCPDWK